MVTGGTHFVYTALEKAARRGEEVIILDYSEYPAAQHRILGIHSKATQSNGHSRLFRSFLFRNKANRTHPMLCWILFLFCLWLTSRRQLSHVFITGMCNFAGKVLWVTLTSGVRSMTVKSLTELLFPLHGLNNYLTSRR